MGLDLYAGPLVRYCSGNWQTINQPCWELEFSFSLLMIRWANRG
jgi:hypothetical protein